MQCPNCHVLGHSTFICPKPRSKEQWLVTPTPEVKEKAYLQKHGPRKSNMNQVFTNTTELPGIKQPERKNTIDITKVGQARRDEIPIQGAHFFLVNLVSGTRVLSIFNRFRSGYLYDSGSFSEQFSSSRRDL